MALLMLSGHGVPENILVYWLGVVASSKMHTVTFYAALHAEIVLCLLFAAKIFGSILILLQFRFGAFNDAVQLQDFCFVSSSNLSNFSVDSTDSDQHFI